MTGIGTTTFLLVFLLFCRVGGCLMIMPGFASPRVPAQIRLFLAIAATLAMAPLLLPGLEASYPGLEFDRALPLIVTETMVGAAIGLMGRMFFMALEFAATAAASYMGLAGLPGVPIDEGEAPPALSSLLTVTATALFFALDLHIEVLRALLATYAVIPVGSFPEHVLGLARMTTVLTDAFLMTLQITSPILIFGVFLNILFGIANKLVPTIPVFFVSTPIVLAGGFILLYFIGGELLRLFITGFAAWLARG